VLLPEIAVFAVDSYLQDVEDDRRVETYLRPCRRAMGGPMKDAAE
jgi:hypothetical protein